VGFPKISRKARYKAASGRLAGQFANRLSKGLLIDRTAQEIGVKDPRVIPVPKGLAKVKL
jgi:hypothetical protein